MREPDRDGVAQAAPGEYNVNDGAGDRIRSADGDLVTRSVGVLATKIALAQVDDDHLRGNLDLQAALPAKLANRVVIELLNPRKFQLAQALDHRKVITGHSRATACSKKS
jgi:hypothetical protein